MSMKYSESATPLALKAHKIYLENDTWRVYYHALSAPDLVGQIVTVINYPQDVMVSFTMAEVVNAIKQGQLKNLLGRFIEINDTDFEMLKDLLITFCNDAKTEYLNLLLE